jgi:deoxyhypusine synthase
MRLTVSDPMAYWLTAMNQHSRVLTVMCPVKAVSSSSFHMAQAEMRHILGGGISSHVITLLSSLFHGLDYVFVITVTCYYTSMSDSGNEVSCMTISFSLA